VERSRKFPESALALATVCASNEHTYFVEASLSAEDCGWVDQPDDPLADSWFFVSAGVTVRRLAVLGEQPSDCPPLIRSPLMIERDGSGPCALTKQ
jgi:hypothetical protein